MRCTATVTAASAALFLVALAGAAPALADDTPVPPATTTAPNTPSADPTDPPLPDPDVDLSLRNTFDADLGSRTRGGDVNVDLSAPLGTGPNGSTLAVTVSASVTVTSVEFEGTAVTCTPAAAGVACTLPASDGIDDVTVRLAVPATTPVGTRVEVTSVLTPIAAADLNPGDNTAVTTFTVVGRADVTQTQSTRLIEVPLGGTAPFTVTLTNNGPDPATNARIGFGINSNDTTRPTLAGFDRPVERGNGSFTWNAGTIPVGGSVSITVTVSATGPVVDSALSFSSSYDGVGQICVNRACLSGAPIRTVAAAPQGGGVAAGGGPVLAETGSADRELALVASGLLVAGAALTAAGRRRRTV